MAPVSSQLIKSLEVTNLPSLPHVLLRLMDLCARDQASLRAIADIIAKDAGVNAKVVSVSSSAQFGRQNNVASLEQKLALLGLDMVQTIVISASVFQLFSGFNQSAGLDLKKFWGRSLTSAFLAKLIAQKISYPNPEEAYLTGLLLDIGQLVMWVNFPKQYAALLTNKVDEDQFIAQESEVIGNNHCEIGAWLISSWNLKSFMADAVLYHHMQQDQIVDAHPLIKIAHVANNLVMVDETQTDVFSDAERLLEIKAEDYKQIVIDTRKLVIKVAQSLDIEIDLTPASNPDNAPLETQENDDLSQKRMELAMELGDVALVGRSPLPANAPETLDGVLLSIQRSAEILFGFKNTIFYLPNSQRNTLKGHSLSEQTEIVNEMSIPVHKGNSIISDAFLNSTPSSTFGNTSISSILDEQIIRLMQTEVLYCQPMTIQSSASQTDAEQNNVVGIIVFGILSTQYSNTEKQKKLISKFAQQSAHKIAALSALNEKEQLIKNEVLATVRTQTQKTVHEANNPLGIIKNYVKLLGIKLSKEDPVQDDLKIIREEIDRVSRVLRTANGTNEAENSLQQDLNANDVIQNLGKILIEALFTQHQVVVQMQLDSSLPNIVTDKDKLIQLMINLIKNAAEAMKNGGTLLISTRANVLHNSTEHIEITVKDNGPGIPEKIMENLFKPVTSTKGGGHSGLGLAIVKNIVDELGGSIFCQSTEISGTTFQILLPLAPEAR